MGDDARDAGRTGTVGPGRVLQLVASGRAVTRTAIGQVTGLSRPTVAQRLEPLFASGLVRESSVSVSSGGRPARTLAFDADAALVLCLDIGEEFTRVAVTNLRSEVLADKVEALRVKDGPAPTLDRVCAVGSELVAATGRDAGTLLGVGVGLPAPVDFASGRTVGWSVMAGWDGYDVRSHLESRLGVPALIDNDVNLLTLAEHRRYWPATRHLFYVKVGTGIGSGLIVEGRINRGSQGAAGDIGHTHLSDLGDAECRCGNRGCLEALAAGWALARDLGATTPGVADLHAARDVVAMVVGGDSNAIRMVREAGRYVGEALAYATSLLNPAVIVVGGSLAACGDHLIAGVRQMVYQRALPLATRQLRISPARLGGQGGIVGATLLVTDAALAPHRLDRALVSPSWRTAWGQQDEPPGRAVVVAGDQR